MQNEISVSYGGGSSPSSIAAALASAFNSSSSSGIYASTSNQSPGVLLLESTSSGTASDVSLNATSSTSDPSDFSSPSFTTNPSGSSLGGGSNNHPISMTFTPDAWGNLQQAGTFSFTQAFSVNNQISTGGYAYDGAGNQTADGLGNTYSYQGDGLLSASNGVAYVYDGAGQRVRKSGSSSNVEYYYFAGKLLAVQDVGTGQWTDYIYAAGRLIAESAGVQTAAPLYRLGDHLDSLAQTSDGSGHVVANNDFAPFGQQVNGDASSRILFTQHEQDTENSSVHALFRQLSPAQGRWLSPDPYRGSYDLRNPQSLNRYAYLFNSPMNAVDPFGLEDVACGEDDCSGVFDDGGDDGGGDGGDSGGGDNGNGGDQSGNQSGDQSGNQTGNQPIQVGNQPTVYVNDTPISLTLEPLLVFGPTIPQSYATIFISDLLHAIGRLNQNSACSAMYGGMGQETLLSTNYRLLSFGPSANSVGAQTNSSSSVFINSAGPFFAPDNGQQYFPNLTPGGVSPGLMIGEVIILHELGHQLSSVTGFMPDAGNINVNQGNTERVLQNCFPK